MTRICTVGVKYSANLGDGVIAECIAHGLRRIDPLLQVEAIDLAGRRQFGDGLDASRGRILAVLRRLPRPLRRIVVGLMLSGLARIRLRPRWAEQLRGCDAVVLGGGQLLADADLNFPIKIGACLGLAARAGLPVAVYGVGCGGAWSARGRRLFRTAMRRADLRALVVRDEASRRRAEQEFANAVSCAVGTCPDPAVLAHEAYGVPLHAPGQTRRAGLCVASPDVLQLHADAGDPAVPLLALYLELAHILVARDIDPVFFTNGAGEDEAFLRGQLVPRLRQTGLDQRVTVAPRPTTPRTLVELIAGLDVVVAHRLHASIIAFALRIPHVGLNWDSKVRSFYQEVDRERFVVEPAEAVPELVIARIEAAEDDPIDPAVWQRVVDRSHASFRALVAALGQRATVPERVPEPSRLSLVR